MASSLIFALLFAVLFLAGLLLIALWVYVVNCDASAAYRLFATRDKLIRAVAIDGLDRNDPWLRWMYGGVNTMLTSCHLLAGPGNWALASKVGTHLGTAPSTREVPDAPTVAPDERVKPVIKDLQAALNHLLRHHIGLRALFAAKFRAERVKERKDTATAIRKKLSARVAG